MLEKDNATIFGKSLQIELDRLRAENGALQAQVLEQTALVEQLLQPNQELEARLAKNSRNSSKPSSSDPPFNTPKPKSLRKSSGKPRGGQKGHRGATRALIDDADQRIVIGLTGQCARKTGPRDMGQRHWGQVSHCTGRERRAAELGSQKDKGLASHHCELATMPRGLQRKTPVAYTRFNPTPHPAAGRGPQPSSSPC